jgi:Prokaryotic E2 family E
MSLRRQFELLPEDDQFLEEYGLPWETIVDGSPWVLIQGFPTRGPYNHAHVTAAIRMETGYPNTALEMVYFSPGLARPDGRVIGATQTIQHIYGEPFQRWSRHRTAQHPWVAGRDNLGTHVLLIEDWLEREFQK